MWPALRTSFVYAHANLLPKKQKGNDRKVYAGRRGLREALDRPMAFQSLEGGLICVGGAG